MLKINMKKIGKEINKSLWFSSLKVEIPLKKIKNRKEFYLDRILKFFGINNSTF